MKSDIVETREVLNLVYRRRFGTPTSIEEKLRVQTGIRFGWKIGYTEGFGEGYAAGMEKAVALFKEKRK